MSHRVLLFGSSTCGKSTLCALVCHFFGRQRGMAPMYNSERNPEGARQIFLWREKLAQGQFPPKTVPNAVQIIDIGFEGGGQRLGFRFLEVAGETVVTLDPLGRNQKDVPAEERIRDDVRSSLDQWLAKAQSIILMISAKEWDAADPQRLATFLDYLCCRELQTKKRVALVVSKWDAQTEHADPRQFAEATCPEALRILGLRFRSSELLAMSVGRVDKNGDRPIQAVDFEAGTRQLIGWLVADGQPET